MSAIPTEGVLLNPWRSIWTQPRATIQQIVETDPEKYVVALAAIAGAVQSLDGKKNMGHVGDQFGLAVILIVSLIVGSLIGVIGLYIGAALLRWTGRWIGGVASTLNLRAAIAWGGVPIFLSGVLWIPMLLLLGREAFTSGTPHLDGNPGLAAGVFVLTVGQGVAGIWALVTMCKTIGQVQGFSAWKALWNSILAILVICVPFFVIAVGVGLLSRGSGEEEEGRVRVEASERAVVLVIEAAGVMDNRHTYNS